MRFILKVLRGEGAKEREIDQRAGSQDEKDGVAQELRQPPGQIDLGKRREGKKKLKIQSF